MVHVPAPIVVPPASPTAILLQTYGVAAYAVQSVVLLLVYVQLMRSGLSARLRGWAMSRSVPRPAQVCIYLVLLFLLLDCVQLPFSLANWLLLRHVGLSVMSGGDWAIRWAKADLVDCALDAAAAGLFLWVTWRWVRWWIPLWIGSAAMVLGTAYLEPIVIDPVFNHYQLMPRGPLRQQIGVLADHAGLGGAPVYVVDKSRETVETNAYVTGIGSTARVVIWDTTLKRMPPDEVLAIVGHEMGHYALHHVAKGIAGSLIALAAALPLFQCVLTRLVTRWGPQWNIHAVSDPAIMPIVLAVVLIVGIVVQPIEAAVSRFVEHQADAYGLALTHNPTAMARAFVDLATQNQSNPDPPRWLELWTYTHPPLKSRIEFALGHSAVRGTYSTDHRP